MTHLHTHDSPAHTFAYLAASFFGLKIPLIVHRRVDFPIGKNLLSSWKYNAHSVSQIICVSDYIRHLITPDIRQPDKLVTVHSGIDLQRFELADNSLKTNRLRSEFQIPSHHFLIVNIAAIAPHKDYFTFVKTAEKLIHDDFPATFLAIGGDGGELAQIRQFIQEKKLEDRVILTGFRKDVPQILPELDLLLFTSKTEGLGTSILDAFACGVPVVATNAGGIPEVVEAGVTGLVCEVGDAECLADAVRKLLTDNILRSKLVENAKRRVQQFSKSAMASAILEIYRNT